MRYSGDQLWSISATIRRTLVYRLSSGNLTGHITHNVLLSTCVIISVDAFVKFNLNLVKLCDLKAEVIGCKFKM